MKNFVPEEIIVESGSDRGPIYRNLKRAFPAVPFVIADRSEAGAPPPTAFGAAKRRLLLARHRGEFLKKCPGSDGQVCCNYFVINFASNCSMDCSYCYLQEYLADNPALKVFGNVDDLIAEADAMLGRHRKFFFRIGTGEITDSLALDPYIGFSAEVVPFFAEQPNVLLELKTKSDCVDGLLGLDPDGKLRYFQPLRVAMYRKMLGWIRAAAPVVFVYLCMESREVWEQVFGFAPSCEKELGNQMTGVANL